MQQNDIVTIYFDPIMKKEREGDAKLIQMITKMDDQIEQWEVKFIGTQYPVKRWIVK